MEKIVKLEEFNWVSGRDAVTIALCNTIIRKQNEIIDHLNTQPKEEVTAEWLYRKNRKRLEDLTEKELKKMGITKTQDTPEETESDVQEWEEEFMDVLETFKDEVCSNFFASSKPLTNFIKQLLSEREREAEKNLLKRFYNATSKEEFRDVLDKLNKKK